MATGLAAEDSVLVLHAHDGNLFTLKKSAAHRLRGDIAFGDLEADSQGIGMTSTAVVHCNHDAIEFRELRGDCVTQIVLEGTHSTLARHMIAGRRDFARRLRRET